MAVGRCVQVDEETVVMSLVRVQGKSVPCLICTTMTPKTTRKRKRDTSDDTTAPPEQSLSPDQPSPKKPKRATPPFFASFQTTIKKFICPISQEFIRDPVDVDGQVFEKAEIAKWLVNSDKHPTRGTTIKNRELHTNLLLKDIISGEVERFMQSALEFVRDEANWDCESIKEIVDLAMQFPSNDDHSMWHMIRVKLMKRRPTDYSPEDIFDIVEKCFPKTEWHASMCTLELLDTIDLVSGALHQVPETALKRKQGAQCLSAYLTLLASMLQHFYFESDSEKLIEDPTKGQFCTSCFEVFPPESTLSENHTCANAELDSMEKFPYQLPRHSLEWFANEAIHFLSLVDEDDIGIFPTSIYLVLKEGTATEQMGWVMYNRWRDLEGNEDSDYYILWDCLRCILKKIDSHVAHAICCKVVKRQSECLQLCTQILEGHGLYQEAQKLRIVGLQRKNSKLEATVHRLQQRLDNLETQLRNRAIVHDIHDIIVISVSVSLKKDWYSYETGASSRVDFLIGPTKLRFVLYPKGTRQSTPGMAAIGVYNTNDNIFLTYACRVFLRKPSGPRYRCDFRHGNMLTIKPHHGFVEVNSLEQATVRECCGDESRKLVFDLEISFSSRLPHDESDEEEDDSSEEDDVD